MCHYLVSHWRACAARIESHPGSTGLTGHGSQGTRRICEHTGCTRASFCHTDDTCMYLVAALRTLGSLITHLSSSFPAWFAGRRRFAAVDHLHQNRDSLSQGKTRGIGRQITRCQHAARGEVLQSRLASALEGNLPTSYVGD